MIEHQYHQAKGIYLHVATAGPEDGQAVVLLHGFPEFSGAWQKQILALAEAGYRVIAPDQRGYYLSDKPSPTAAYRDTELVADIIALLDALNIEQAVIIGHDWGGAVAWWLAAQHPDRVARLIILNSPHPVAMRQALQTWRQKLKSSYMQFFNIPFVSEKLLGLGGGFLLWQGIRRTARPHAFNAADRKRYQEAWRQPNAIKGMLNWYRALLRHGASIRVGKISCPTLIIWGERDAFFSTRMAHDSAHMCENVQLHLLPEATHWLHHEDPDHINTLIATFLSVQNP
ncbi:MAG: alpha/beta hydrolase [Phototrophicales bacterium]|nr:MAG: alpha/beta hydrolase [Phototrophicales bacterium]